MKTQLIKHSENISLTGLKNKKIEHLFILDKDTLKFLKRDIFVREVDSADVLKTIPKPKGEKVYWTYLKPDAETTEMIAIWEKQPDGTLEIENVINGPETSKYFHK